MDIRQLQYPTLTAFDYEVIRLSAQGHSQKQIARVGGFSPSSVKDLFDRTEPQCLYRRMPGIQNPLRLHLWWADTTNAAVEHPEDFFDVSALERSRMEGNAVAVIEETRKNRALLLGFLDRHPNADNRRDILKWVSDLSIVHGLAVEDTSTNAEYRHKIAPVIQDLTLISVQLGDRQASIFALVFDAVRRYKENDFSTCLNRLARALPYTSNLSAQYQHLKMLPVAGVLITSAHLENERQVLKNEETSLKMLEGTPVLDEETLSDSLRMRARAWGMLKNGKSVELLDKAWDTFEAIPNPTPRQGAKLVKTMLEIATYIPGTVDRTFIETQAEKWLQLVQSHKLRFQAIGIENRLKGYLGG